MAIPSKALTHAAARTHQRKYNQGPRSGSSSRPCPHQPLRFTRARVPSWAFVRSVIRRRRVGGVRAALPRRGHGSLRPCPIEQSKLARIPDEVVDGPKSMLRLDCAIQQYAWGKTGHASAVAQLKEKDGTGYVVDAEQRYAELWMGTHPSGPSKVLPTQPGEEPVLLREYLKSNPTAMGGQAAAVPAGDLPFMFKVLSIDKALSIQAHPDKKLAERLHAARPTEYKDANHKPEMAISLTDFEAMCGFRPLEEVVAHLQAYPELRALVSDQAFAMLDPLPAGEADRKLALKAVFSSYMTADDALAATQVAALAERLSAVLPGERSPLDALIVRLHEHFPGDRGLMGPLFLNYVRLGPGQAFVMRANEPHAYLSGDILECMACSDNVVRVGLTPKYRDVPTLLGMLNYTSGPMRTTAGDVVEHASSGSGSGSGIHRRFNPGDIEEFEVETVLLQAGERLAWPAVDGPSVVLVLDGFGVADTPSGREELAKGRVFFVAANTSLRLEGMGATPLHLAIAHANFHMPK